MTMLQESRILLGVDNCASYKKKEVKGMEVKGRRVKEIEVKGRVRDRRF